VREEHQRRRILKGAIEVFAQAGYPATTVDDVVAAARIGVGSFYAQFSGKEECLLAAYDQVVEEAQRAVAAAASTGSTWPDQVCRGLQALLDWLAAEPAHGKVALVEIQTAGPAALARFERDLDEMASLMRQGREHAQPPRLLPDSIELTTVSGIAWLLNRRLAAADAGSIPSLFQDLGELVLEPYLGEDAARAAIAAARPAGSN
jgi:AcrR family transcriptional regulator